MIKGVSRSLFSKLTYNGNAAPTQTNLSFQNRLINKAINADNSLSGITARSNRSFNGLDTLGPSAPDKVKDAWTKAEEETGANGYGMNSEGKLTQITILFAMSIEKMANGGGQDILGSTVDSAKAVFQRALERLGIPQNDKEKKEQLFYEAFLRFLD